MAEIIRKSAAVAPYSWTPDSMAVPITDHPSFASLVEVYRHNLDRMQDEWMQAWNCVFQVNSAPRPVDKMKVCQDWLKGLSQRRTEDAIYAFEVARELSGVEMRFAMGLVTKDDQQAALAV
jgi:hypothetical protein